MEPVPPPWPPGRPRGSAPVLRWGIPDAAIAWACGFLGAIVGFTVGLVVTGRPAEEATDDGFVFGLAIAGQFGAMLLAMVVISRRKGIGSLAADFGFRVDARDGLFVLWGVLLQIGLGLALLPIALLDDRRQDVVDLLGDADGARLVVLVVSAALVAPVVEEILFRGLLLRAVLRRAGPAAAVSISALAFGAVHLTDPNAVTALPGLVGFGLVAGVVAVRSGSLSRPILLHVGFNLLTVVVTAAGGG